MKILAVCGFGVGSSMILKMSIDKVLKEMGIDAEVNNTDINDARGTECDVIFTSPELQQELQGTVGVPVYPVKKYMDLEEVKDAIQKYLNNK